MQAQNTPIPTVSSMASLLLRDWPYGVDQIFYFIIILTILMYQHPFQWQIIHWEELILIKAKNNTSNYIKSNFDLSKLFVS